MLANKKHRNKKFKFEDNDIDFSWDTDPEKSDNISDDDYGNLLRKIYRYNPSKLDFETGFTMFDD